MSLTIYGSFIDVIVLHNFRERLAIFETKYLGIMSICVRENGQRSESKELIMYHHLVVQFSPS